MQRRAASLARELEEASRQAACERARADSLAERVSELSGLLAQSQENYDALVRARRPARPAARPPARPPL
jgi:hypothetical protein